MSWLSIGSVALPLRPQRLRPLSVATRSGLAGRNTTLPSLNKNPSFSERDAMALIVSEIADEATRAGVPLTETERKMLSFSESAPNAREFVDVVEAFERECDEHQYERRIADLIRAARKRADKNQAASWSAAIERLKESDNYLGVMLDQTGTDRSQDLSWRGIVAVLSLLGAFGLLQVAILWYIGDTHSRDAQAFFTWLAAMVCAVAYLASRWVFGTQRVDDFIGQVTDRLFGVPKR